MLLKNDRQLVISVGNSRNSTNWRPLQLSVGDLYDRLRAPVRTGAETLAEFMAWPKAKQDDAKDAGGFVAGTLDGGRRTAAAVIGRDVVTLDMDNCARGDVAALEARLQRMGCSWCIYSTRKHTPERPRLRVLLPLDRTVDRTEYQAIARRVAEALGMMLCDRTTFEPNRLMYWPSASADSEYYYRYQDAPLLSADGELDSYADFRDVAAWPMHPEEEARPRRAAEKAEDPRGKAGTIGAFCRCYSITEAVEEFLPDVYAPADDSGSRWTYTGGTSTGGAVVYEDLFLYSHHATDPAGGQLLNAFDLVRVHMFGDRDDGAKDGTPVTRLPSYHAALEWAVALPRVRQELAAGTFLPTAETPAEGDDVAVVAAWWAALPAAALNSKTGLPNKTLQNYVAALELDPQLAGGVRLNEFSGRAEAGAGLPWRTTGGTWGDTDDAQLRAYLEPVFGKPARQDLEDAVRIVSSRHKFHPVRDYLSALVWDGVPRLDTLLVDYMGAEDTPYTRAVTRKQFAGAVARVFQPGIKFDTMLVFVGEQGGKKSTFFSIMGGEWFSDSLQKFEGREAMESVQGRWLLEIPELQAMRKSEVEGVKAFLTKRSDYYRAAYGRHAEDRPRQCVIFGTTNTPECLTDTTGNRRFWPVDIDVQPRRKSVVHDLPRERNQIWVEAVLAWNGGEALYLDDRQEVDARAVQEEHREAHPWEAEILNYLDTPQPRRRLEEGAAMLSADGGNDLEKVRQVCYLELWERALGYDRRAFGKKEAHDLGVVMLAIPGWKRGGRAYCGKYGQQRIFCRKP